MLTRIMVLVAVCGMTQIVHADGWTNMIRFQRRTYSPVDEMNIFEIRAKIYERAAIALSKLEVPDFSDFSEDAVYDAFWSAFDGFSADKVWLKELKSRINELSGGTVKLRNSSFLRFNIRVRGPAEYLILKKGKTRIRVLLGPYPTPVIFDK